MTSVEACSLLISRYRPTVTLSFVITDRAGNKTTVKIDLQVSYTAILVKDVGRKALPTIAPSTTLQALIGHG